jgi:hypothetical protein
MIDIIFNTNSGLTLVHDEENLQCNNIIITKDNIIIDNKKYPKLNSIIIEKMKELNTNKDIINIIYMKGWKISKTKTILLNYH